MTLGVFSLSISVKNLADSKAFYEHLGFEQFAGSMESNYLIMKQGQTLIGLFYGMFEGNMLTFNPGWDANAAEVNPYDDIRTIQKALLEKGIAIAAPIDEQGQGPAHLVITDPDGNVILVDQHR